MVVGAALAAVVGSAVITSVTTALGSAAAGTVGSAVGTGGAGSASSSAGSSNVLITQVQMLNMYGRIGGSNASEGIRTLTDGFGWSNFELGLRLDTSLPAERRAKKAQFDSGTLNTDDVEDYGPCDVSDYAANASECVEFYGDDCSLAEVAPPVEKLLTCLIVLCGCWAVRILLGVICSRSWRPPKDRRDWPDSLLFPSWEAPMLLAQSLPPAFYFSSFLFSSAPLNAYGGINQIPGVLRCIRTNDVVQV